MVWRDHMTILWRSTANYILAEVINGAFTSPKSFNLSSIAMCQTCNFAKGNAVSFDFFQRLTAIQHRVIKPSPRTCNWNPPSSQHKTFVTILNSAFCLGIHELGINNANNCHNLEFLSTRKLFSKNMWNMHGNRVLIPWIIKESLISNCLLLSLSLYCLLKFCLYYIITLKKAFKYIGP